MDADTYNKLLTVIGGKDGPRSARSKIAKMFGITHYAVSMWEKKRIPAERVIPLEKACKKKVTRKEMRPDLYP